MSQENDPQDLDYLKTLTAMVEVEDEDYNINMGMKDNKYHKVAYKTGENFKRSYTHERFSRL